MNKQFKLLYGTSAVVLLACSALAQTTPNQTTDAREDARQGMLQGRTNQQNYALKASDVIGMKVKNLQNEKLGKVQDLAVDVTSGHIVQVIISTGGFLGVGSSLIAVPPTALNIDMANKVIQLDVSQEKLAAAPKFDTLNWEALNQSNQVSEVYAYFGQTPYFNTSEDVNPNLTAKAHRGDVVDSQTETATATTASSFNPWSKSGEIHQGSKFMGTTVKNSQDEAVGKIENFIVDFPAGRILAVVVSTGGALGMGGELNAIPPSAFQCNAAHDALILDASKETLAGSPHFSGDHWPDFNQRDYDAEFYHAYNVQPYFSTNAIAQADNTARNVRDRNNASLTPFDQGNSQSDLRTTAMIRKEIINDNGMSVYAQNIKIITKDGHVTLRGPVTSSEEKQHVEDIANRIAQSGNVDSQLEVAHNPSTSMDN